MTNNDYSTRLKIIFQLRKSTQPMTLTELTKELQLDKELVFHHLKNLKEEFVVAELPDKTYTLQSFFYDDNTMEDLNGLMKLIITRILRELGETDYTEDQLGEALKNNLQLFIETFSIEIS